MMTKLEIYRCARNNLLFIQHQQATELKELDRYAPEELRQKVEETYQKILWITQEIEKLQGAM